MAEESPIKGFEVLAWWAMALKDVALSGRKGKHNGAHLKHNGEGMKVKAWPNEAAWAS